MTREATYAEKRALARQLIERLCALGPYQPDSGLAQQLTQALVNTASRATLRDLLVLSGGTGEMLPGVPWPRLEDPE